MVFLGFFFFLMSFLGSTLKNRNPNFGEELFLLSAQFQGLTSPVFKNMINIYVPAPRRWQPGYDELRPRQGLLRPLFPLSNITQYD